MIQFFGEAKISPRVASGDNRKKRSSRGYKCVSIGTVSDLRTEVEMGLSVGGGG